MQSFGTWVLLPENRSAQAAVERVAAAIGQGRTRNILNPLFLHGPAGAGKTHLVTALLFRVTQHRPDLTATVLEARQLEQPDTIDSPADLVAARQADVVVVEDLQHLTGRVVEPVVQLIDYCQGRQRQLIVTATAGPAELTQLPSRLTSRLAAGLVVGLLPLSPASRLAFLQARASRRQLAVGPDVLAWLADNIPGSGRQLEGALNRLETLLRLDPNGLTVDLLAEQFQIEAEQHRPSVERIARRVGDYFRVEPEQLQSRRRSHDALLPRQVGMYLARQLTGLSLEQIGAWFGGRDHSTVLHACRKVEQALAHDITLSGAVRQLHADLA
jgi:chromosomal replication initiator protein